MTNINQTPGWEEVPELSTSTVALGGPDGAMNSQAKALEARSKLLRNYSRDALRRSYADAGYNLVDGTFEEGGTLSGASDVMLSKSGKAYSWGGAYPDGGMIVAPGTNPESVAGYIDRSSEQLRNRVVPHLDLTPLTSEYPNSSSGLNAAMADALDGSRVVVVNSDMSVNGTELSRNLTEVAFSGSKAIAGPYRKKVVDEFRAPFVPANTVNPELHLKSLRKTTAPVVVIMGDSISTEGPDAITLADSMWSVIKEKLAKDNPTKSFSFHNRAIGGQTWLHANSTPTAFPYWYTNTSADWLTYIEALQPDVLFFGFGMNDANGFNAGALVSVVNKVKAWAKVPDLVFITNPVPAQTTVYPDGSGFGFVGQTFQEGRDYAAGYARSFAQANGYGVVDINRAMVAMRDCYDVANGIMKKVASVSASSYTATSAANDFSFKCSANGASWAEGKVLAVKCGLENSDFIFIKKTSGNFVVEGFAAGVSTYNSVATGVAVPAGAFGLEVSVIGGIARLIIDPASTGFENKRVIAEFAVVRHGGIFLPVISWQSEAGGPFTAITYSTGYDDAKYKQAVTDSDVWGESSLTADIKEPFGGNGINHYSAKGIALVVRPAVEACDFGVGETLTGIHAGGRWVKHADGGAEFSKSVTLSSVAISAAVGSGFVQASPVADTDFPAIFMSDGSGGFVFETSVHVLSDGARYIWAVADGSSRLNNAIRYRLASFASVTGATITVQIKMRGRWK